MNEEVCECWGNQECHICYKALVDAFDVSYQIYKAAGLEDCLEAKEFMWDFYADRDRAKADEAFDNVIPDEFYLLKDSW